MLHYTTLIILHILVTYETLHQIKYMSHLEK